MGAVIIIVGLILMVVIHEGAHFVAAKTFGMKVTEAFFGFGARPLWSVKRGETEYGVKPIPLGGYVKIIGMNPFEEVAPEDEGRTYRENPFWKKAIVVLAGVASHFVIAIVLFYAVIVGFGVPEVTTSIGRVCPAIVESLDIADPVPFAFTTERCDIVEVDGVPVQDWTGAEKDAGALTTVTVEIGGVRTTTRTTDRIVPTPALLSPIEVGDRIAEFDGVAVVEWRDFVEAAVAVPGKTVDVVVERDGTLIEFTSTLVIRTSPSGSAQGFFGVIARTQLTEYSVLGGVGAAGARTWEAMELSVRGLGSLVANFGDLLTAPFTGDEPPAEARPISPIGLSRVAAAHPVEVSVELLALVNVFVGLLNFVPMYPLDGGHFAVALYEKARGRPADVRKLMPIAVAVFLFVVILGLLAIYYDIVDLAR